jgi:hypothetical protein
MLLSMLISEILALFFGLNMACSISMVGCASRLLCSKELSGAIAEEVISLFLFDFFLLDSVKFESCEGALARTRWTSSSFSPSAEQMAWCGEPA